MEESSAKGNFSGQFPTKPCVNPRNLSYKTQLNACNSFMVSKGASNMNSCQEHDNNNRSLNAISCLRNGKMLPNIFGKKQKRLEQGEEKNQISEKEVVDSEVNPEVTEEREIKEERLIPFPNALTSNEKKTENSHLLDVFKNTTITIPLTDAIQYIPTYGKFVKELCTSSRKKRTKLSENVSSILLHSLPEKKKDPGAP